MSLEILDDWMRGEVGQQGGEIEGEGVLLLATLTVTTGTTALTTGVWRRAVAAVVVGGGIVVCLIVTLIGCDDSRIRSLAVDSHGVRRC